MSPGPQEDGALAGAVYTALRAAKTNNSAIALIRIVLAEMNVAAKTNEPVDPVEPHVWEEVLEWVCGHMEADNDQVLDSMRKAGRVLS